MLFRSVFLLYGDCLLLDLCGVWRAGMKTPSLSSAGAALRGVKMELEDLESGEEARSECGRSNGSEVAGSKEEAGRAGANADKQRTEDSREEEEDREAGRDNREDAG